MNKSTKSKKHERIGEKRLMKNGQYAIITKYNNSLDIEIKFIDDSSEGTYVKTRYDHFYNGTVNNPNDKNIIGKSLRMKNGLVATIIACRNHDDIDVIFEDGKKVYNKSYGNFKKRQIKHPEFTAKRIINDKGRLHETKIMKNGLEAEIISYRKYDDIDVLFTSDGYISYNRSYYDFDSGNIKNCNFKYRKADPNKYLGSHKIMNNGQEATIIGYRNCNDIDVQFEDGEVVENKRLSAFNTGGIKNPKKPVQREPLRVDRIGEISFMHNGHSATIVRYRRNNDIDIVFDDGTVKEHVDYNEFNNGAIAHPNDKANGTSLQEFTIIYYLNKYGFNKFVKRINNKKFEIDVFNETYGGIEYDGRRWHIDKADKDNDKSKTFYKIFGKKLIHIREIGLDKLNNKYSKTYILVNDKPLSIEYQKLLIIVFKNEFGLSIDVDLERDKNEICKEYYSFCNHINERRKMNNGMFAKITSYRGCDDIDVIFDDGYIAKNKQYSNFKRGNIANHNIKYSR